MTASSPLPFERVRRLIESEGALPIATYMAIANAHYYATRDPLGRLGDFTTAPEISQMFGELMGLWLADSWHRAGRPDAALVELGPGRGTLMADALRALSRVPGLSKAPVHLVETSPTLRKAQRQRIPAAHWHDDIASLPQDRALLVIANEFFDALPVRQFVRTGGGWRERMVALDGAGRFMAVAGRGNMDPLIPPPLADSPDGAIVETSPASIAITSALADMIQRQGGAALIVDYGYEGPAAGDTLQGMKEHRYADVFSNVGDVDLTAHVDFAALAEAARLRGAHAYGPVEQGVLLERLGIAARASALKQTNPTRAADIDADVERLTSAMAMGSLFKALAITGPGWPIPGGF